MACSMTCLVSLHTQTMSRPKNGCVGELAGTRSSDWRWRIKDGEVLNSRNGELDGSDSQVDYLECSSLALDPFGA